MAAYDRAPEASLLLLAALLDALQLIGSELEDSRDDWHERVVRWFPCFHVLDHDVLQVTAAQGVNRSKLSK